MTDTPPPAGTITLTLAQDPRVADACERFQVSVATLSAQLDGIAARLSPSLDAIAAAVAGFTQVADLLATQLRMLGTTAIHLDPPPADPVKILQSEFSHSSAAATPVDPGPAGGVPARVSSLDVAEPIAPPVPTPAPAATGNPPPASFPRRPATVKARKEGGHVEVIRKWSDARRERLRIDYPTSDLDELVERLNKLPGPPITKDQMYIYAASLGVKRLVPRPAGRTVAPAPRQPTPATAKRRPSVPLSRDGLPSLAGRLQRDDVAASMACEVIWPDAVAWADANKLLLNGDGDADLMQINLARANHGLPPFTIVLQRGVRAPLPKPTEGGGWEGEAPR